MEKKADSTDLKSAAILAGSLTLLAPCATLSAMHKFNEPHQDQISQDSRERAAVVVDTRQLIVDNFHYSYSPSPPKYYGILPFIIDNEPAQEQLEKCVLDRKASKPPVRFPTLEEELPLPIEIAARPFIREAVTPAFSTYAKEDLANEIRTCDCIRLKVLPFIK